MSDTQVLFALAALVGKENVSVEADALRQASGSWSPALVKARQSTGEGEAGQNAASAVVRPCDTDKAAGVVRWANETKTRLVVVGGASNTVGSNQPAGSSSKTGRSVVYVDMSRLNQVDWEEENLLVHAGAGVNLGQLEEQLNAHDYTLGHLPHSLCLATIGGCVATNAIGILAGRYGRQADLTMGLQVVLPTGAIVETAPTNAPGSAHAVFNLHDLHIGGEGAFGIVTRATLRMRPMPEVRAWAAFSFASFDDGVDALRLIYRSDSRPALTRLFGKAESAARLDAPGFLLLLAFEGDELVQTGPYQVAYGVCQAVGGTVQSADLGDAWWSDNLQKGTGWLAPNGRPDGLADGFAFSAPWDKIKTVRRDVEAALAPLVTGVNLHIAYAYPTGGALDMVWQADAGNGDPQTLLARITNAGLTAGQNAGATIAHHYGVGKARRDAFARERGEAGMAALRTVQAALDPNGILRPAALETQ